MSSKLNIVFFIILLFDYGNCVRRVGDRRILSLAAATDDCATSLEDNNSIVCRSLVSCNNELFYRQFNRIVFDLTSSSSSKLISLDKQTFNNCFISALNRQVEITFRNVQEIKSFAFHQFEMEVNTRLSLKFDGGAGKDAQLIVKKNAFNAFHLSKNAQLNIEIMNYKSVIIQDALVKQDNTGLIQDQNSSFYLNIHDCDIVLMKPTTSTSQDTNLNDDLKLEPPQPHDLFDQNRTYSLQILHVDQVRIDVGIFSDLQIMPYCTVTIEIRSAYSCSLADNSFERLLIGTSARFSLLIQNVNYASIGKNLFKSLEQSAVSSFFFQMDQINGGGSSTAAMGSNSGVKKRAKKSLIKNDKLNQYYEEDNPLYDDEEDYDATDDESDEQDDLSYDTIQTTTSKNMEKSSDSQLFDEWFCVPEYLFKNVEQAESSTGQVHFTRFKMSISVSSLAFSEFQLSDNSKFQILFQDMRGHIVFDTKSIDLIRLSDGIFEIWIEDHRQLVNDKGNRQKSKFNSKDSFSNQSSLKSQPFADISPLRLLKKARNTHLKLNDLAFNKIFLNSHSLFRVGYINSDSLFLISPKALNGFHIDELATNLNNRQDYRTKISFEIKQSDNVHFEFVSQQDLVTNEEDLSNFPKLIEIDAYEPIMSNEKENNNDKLLSQVEINMRQQEFCRYFKLRPLIAPLKYKLPNAAFNANSFIYFSVPIKLISTQDDKNKTKYCTSCLFIYLYRTLHRRHDFYFVKDYLPPCFISLHYGDNLYLVHKRNNVKMIEQTFQKYWSQLNCEKITGLSSLFQYDVYASNQSGDESILDPKQTEFIGDETFADFERMSKHCRKTQESTASLFSRHDDEIKSVERLSQEKWHDLVPKICSKNVLDASMNNSRYSIKIGQKKYSLIDQQKKSRFSWSIFFVVFILVCGLTVMFGLAYLQYTKKHGNNLPSNVSHYITQVRSSLKMHRLNSNNFEQLNNETETETKTIKKVTSVTYNKLVKNDHKLTNDSDDDDDDNNREEIHFDDLNAYEYDDEFGLANNSNNSNNNDQFKTMATFATTDSAYVTTTISNTTPNSNVFNNLADKFKKIKNNLFTNSSFLSFHNNSASSSIPNYIYNSTAASLIQTNIKNEFKSAKETEEEDEDKPNVEIVYDIAKQKSKQNIIKNNGSNLVNEDLKEKDNILRLSTNPLETYLDKFEMNNIKKQETNESDA